LNCLRVSLAKSEWRSIEAPRSNQLAAAALPQRALDMEFVSSVSRSSGLEDGGDA